MREKIGKTGDKVITGAGLLYYRLISIIPAFLTYVTGSNFLDALRAGDLLGCLIMGALAVSFGALVWYLWRPHRRLSELEQ